MPKRDFTFECDHQKIAVEPFRKSLVEATCFTEAQKLELLEFYTISAKIDTCKLGGTLSDYGWKGSALLGRLEKKFIDICSFEERFLIAFTGKMPKTIKRFGLNTGSKICVDCPRGVVAGRCEVVEGVVKRKNGDTRMETVLRHIRNAIAHGNTFFFDNDNCLLIDKDREKNTSAALLMPSQALVEFIGFVEAGPKD